MEQTVGGQIVSRETYEELTQFVDLARKWTSKINLIAPSTVGEIWNRHVADSAQIYALAPKSFINWVDIGSGGGFPGIIIAILAKADRSNASITLIESDQRKATFLRTAIRELTLPARVIAARSEETAPQIADVVSARAVTSLSAIMPHLQRHLSLTGYALLHKGKRYQQEISQARQSWSFDLEERPSLTDPEGRIVVIKGIKPLGNQHGT